MDSQALLTPDAVDRYMGVPLAHVPAPPGSDAPSYARHFVGELFLGTFEPLGLHPEVYWMSEVYIAGDMDRYIRAALDAAETIRTIYRDVSHVDKEPGWLPLSVICTNCGRVGTTLATDWDGETVAFACRAGPGRVGNRLRLCGPGIAVRRRGQAAVQRGLGRQVVPIRDHHRGLWQGPGHGGWVPRPVGRHCPPGLRARATAEHSPRVHQHRRPEDEHLARNGVAAHEIAQVMPPDELRMLFVRHRPNVAFEFDPDQTDAIPRLLDEFDRLAAATAGRPVRGELPADPDRIFAASLTDAEADVAAEAAAHRPAFAHLAMLVQLPGVDVPERVTAEKGSPLTERELVILARRTDAARAWLERYAPPEAGSRCSATPYPASPAR